MKHATKLHGPNRLSREELEMSRRGTLGRFPAPDLYDSEVEVENTSEAAAEHPGQLQHESEFSQE